MLLGGGPEVAPPPAPHCRRTHQFDRYVFVGVEVLSCRETPTEGIATERGSPSPHPQEDPQLLKAELQCPHSSARPCGSPPGPPPCCPHAKGPSCSPTELHLLRVSSQQSAPPATRFHLKPPEAAINPHRVTAEPAAEQGYGEGMKGGQEGSGEGRSCCPIRAGSPTAHSASVGTARESQSLPWFGSSRGCWLFTTVLEDGG